MPIKIKTIKNTNKKSKVSIKDRIVDILGFSGCMVPIVTLCGCTSQRQVVNK